MSPREGRPPAQQRPGSPTGLAEAKWGGGRTGFVRSCDLRSQGTCTSAPTSGHPRGGGGRQAALPLQPHWRGCPAQHLRPLGQLFTKKHLSGFFLPGSAAWWPLRHFGSSTVTLWEVRLPLRCEAPASRALDASPPGPRPQDPGLLAPLCRAQLSRMPGGRPHSRRALGSSLLEQSVCRKPTLFRGPSCPPVGPA